MAKLNSDSVTQVSSYAKCSLVHDHYKQLGEQVYSSVTLGLWEALWGSVWCQAALWELQTQNAGLPVNNNAFGFAEEGNWYQHRWD